MMDDSTTFSCWGSANEDIIKSQFPLHRACRDGDVETLSLLLMEAQHGVYVEDSFYGWTPAHWAAHFGKLACLRKLTMVGVACDGCSSRFQQTPAHMAAFGGQPHVLQWLLQARVGLDKQDYLGETALHKAARSGSIECVSLLVANGAHLRLCNNGGLDAARLAESCGHEACGQFLHSAVAQKEHSLTNGTAISQPRNTTETENGDCEMEVTESDRVVTNGYGGIGDVTLTCDISASITRMAGRKRAWDCGGMVECKRMRRTDLFTYPPPEWCDSSLLLAPQPHCETLPLDDYRLPSLNSQPITGISSHHEAIARRNSASSRCRLSFVGQCCEHEAYTDVLAMSVKPMTPVILPSGCSQSTRRDDRCYSVFV